MIGTRRKRPCRICGRWFTPDPRVGERQKTCGDAECKRKWHAKKCAEWNQRHAEVFRANYLARKLAAASPPPTPSADVGVPIETLPCHPPKSRLGLGLPRDDVQEVIGLQALVVIEYLGQQLFRRFQEVITRQVLANKRESMTLPPFVFSRSDGFPRGPGPMIDTMQKGQRDARDNDHPG